MWFHSKPDNTYRWWWGCPSSGDWCLFSWRPQRKFVQGWQDHTVTYILRSRNHLMRRTKLAASCPKKIMSLLWCLSPVLFLFCQSWSCGLSILQRMESYSSTESDPLEKFLFPFEISALRGGCVKPFNSIHPMFCSILSWWYEINIGQDSLPWVPICQQKGQIIMMIVQKYIFPNFRSAPSVCLRPSFGLWWRPTRKPGLTLTEQKSCTVCRPVEKWVCRSEPPLILLAGNHLQKQSSLPLSPPLQCVGDCRSLQHRWGKKIKWKNK